LPHAGCKNNVSEREVEQKHAIFPQLGDSHERNQRYRPI
jgi:hypothetical protein